MSGQGAVENEVLYYVADEVCILVFSKDSPDHDTQRTRYIATRDFLNARVSGGPPLRSLEEMQRDPVLGIQPLIFSDANLIRRLPDGTPAALQPWVARARQNDGTSDTLALYFYNVGARPSDDRPVVTQETRDKLAAINDFLETTYRTDQAIHGTYGTDRQIALAMPNRLNNGTSHELSGGGPGSPAEPIPPTSNSSFGIIHVSSSKHTSTGTGLTVAILDTCPGAPIHNKNRLLGQMGKGKAHLDDHNLNPALHVLASNAWIDAHIQGQDYAMADHGLFNAGIIHDLAPDAEIHLIRVLTDWCVGNLRVIFAGLKAVFDTFTAGPLVINLSLMFNTPTAVAGSTLPEPPKLETVRVLVKCLYPNLTGQAFDDKVAQYMPTPTSAFDQALEDLFIDAVKGRDKTLLVAAAGNDSVAGATRQADAPASYASSLGNLISVAAASRDGVMAPFSNDGEVKVFVTLSPGGATSSIIGIFNDATTSPSGHTNTDGWVTWAGTSFTTAIISGLAAARWSADPKQSSSTVKGGIVALTHTLGGTASGIRGYVEALQLC